MINVCNDAAFLLVANRSVAQLIQAETNCLMLPHIGIIFYPNEKASELSPLIIPHKVIPPSCLPSRCAAALKRTGSITHVVVFFFFPCLCVVVVLGLS